MEELGIGRPSTYASILQVLQDREYVKLDKRRFQPEDRGRLVTAFLVAFFERYVDTGFTAGLEEQLDDISGGRIAWREVMREFWDQFSRAVGATKDLKISDVIDALDEELGPHFFPARGDGTDPRACPACAGGRLGLRLGRSGAFVGCSNYPECRYTRPLAVPGAEGENASTLNEGQRELGDRPGHRPDRHPAARALRALRAARRGRHGREGQADQAAPRQPDTGHGPGDARSRSSAGAPVPAARCRPRPGDGWRDHRRHRPLRALHPPRHGVPVAGAGRRRARRSA